MELYVTVDWLAVTFKEDRKDVHEFCRLYASSATLVPETAHHGYSASTRDAMGVVQSWNTDRPEMGLHVVFAGSALQNLQQRASVDMVQLVKEAVNAGGRVSRLDLAKDAKDVDIRLEAVYQAITQDENEGLARTYSRIQSNKGGYTIYVGSRQSERFIRLYDKAVEQGEEGGQWKRLEIELKGDVARAVAAQFSHVDLPILFDNLVLAMINLPYCDDWTTFFDNRLCKVGLPKIEKQTDREKWITTQVTPAVGKHFIEHPDSEAVNELIELLLYLRINR